MSESEPFDLLNCPLDRTNLIEASAGTGKTYALSGLYLRLLLEQELTVPQILVVTFTEAATEELKDRIRDKLRQALNAARGKESPEPFILDLMKRQKDPARSMYLLRRAIRSFDEAAISTIHGFCYRVLRENAFESGCPFEIEIVPDDSALLETLVQDYWRRKISTLSKPFVRYLEMFGTPVSELLGLATRVLSRPDVEVVPQGEALCCINLEQQLGNLYQQLQDHWFTHGEAIRKILLNDQVFKQNLYRKAWVSNWLDQLDQYLANNESESARPDSGPEEKRIAKVVQAIAPLPARFDRFTQSSIDTGVKNGCEPPRHPFFECCEQVLSCHEALLRCYHQARLALALDLFEYVRSELQRQKMESGARSYGDLLTDVRDAFLGSGGEALAEAVQGRYRAALIDEFQDTDPVQYAIFQRLFQTRQHTLFLIGDPKQAIYGFRGADVFAYLKASGDVARKFYLEQNWRSDPGLITACNTLFASNRAPFIYPEIRFQPVLPAAKERDSLSLANDPVPPMEFWFVRAREVLGKEKLNKADAERVIFQAVSTEIARLVELGRQSKLLLGTEPLRERDIAVLVRSNVQASSLQGYLKELSVPSVLYQIGDLFETREAREMFWLLSGIRDPSRERAVRTALATSMIGLNALDLDQMQTDEDAWNRWLERIRGYRDLWFRAGFMPMLKSVLTELKVLPRLTGTPGGERTVTNLLHLAEVLHRESQQQGLGPAELVKWLAERRNGTQPRRDEHLLRMETDEAAVRIITMHKSKGLEFPVVFCPFCWSGARPPKKGEPVLSHDPEENRRLIMDLGSDQWDRRADLAVTEDLAESLRLLYVALTRARNRCYLTWGEFTNTERSAPAYLFHDPRQSHAGGENRVESGTPNPETVGGEPGKRSKKSDRVDFFRDLQEIVGRADGSIDLRDIPLGSGSALPVAEKSPGPLSCRTFRGRVDRSWRLTSFSALVSGRVRSPDAVDRDEAVPGVAAASDSLPREPVAEAKPLDIFSFPKGARAGTVLHDMFERLDFECDLETNGRRVVENVLAQYGFDPIWTDPVLEMVERVLTVPLSVDRPDFRLNRIPVNQRLSELEFHFPVPPVGAADLNDLLADYLIQNGVADSADRIGSLTFSPAKGFMKGFIDLVFRFEGRFYLVDWKSNFLGEEAAHYDQPAMVRVMTEHFYVLQYLIYSLALDRYLALRIPDYRYDTHFGGVFYLFLRGVDPRKGPDFGVYRDRPAPVWIRKLGSLLMAQPKETAA